MSQAATAGSAPRVAEAPVRSRRMSRQLLRPLLMLGGIVVVAVASGTYWLTGGRYVSIDDTYVRAAKETLATDISGTVQSVPVREGQRVKKGDVLLQLDPRQFQIAVDGARGNLGAISLDLNARKVDYQRMLREVEVKQAQVQSDQANFDRFASLVKSGGVTRADYDNARFQLATDQQAVLALKMMAEVQLAKLGGDPSVDVRTMPDYLQAKARLDEAQRQLDDTVIHAPFDGIVTQVDTVQPGMYLAASTAAFGIVSTEDVWVEANPKETELTWVKPGDPVDVVIDTYPGRHWKAVVGSIAPNSGSEFSVLPAQNTSGNWVKVVQRIPVRIRVERQPGDPELRAGMSVEAEIDTGHHRTLADLF
ncbi:MAG TPA: HlyD family secretion protein [Acetobacteraceae bacterium]|jgi:membrane fusion protein (multidrug efflux system)|nr:HlyD family secretion protein [Acetobacteraceae bacterium]